MEDLRSTAEAIMGQMTYAVGSGARDQWVTRNAILTLRDFFLGFIRKALDDGEDWERDAPRVLHYMRTIGRLAAYYSYCEGGATIRRSQMRDAIEKVVANYRILAERVEPTPLGRWCGE